MTAPRFTLTSALERLLGRFRGSHLALILGLLFVVDLFIPDPLPFVDEAVLAILALLAGKWATRGDSESAPTDQQPGPIDITDRSSDDGPS